MITSILGYNVADIIISDYSRLTDYGLGYLTGLFLMFSIFVVFTVIMSKKIFNKK
jgi:hypothetical protein